MIKFGTGGWRAIIADEFTKKNIRLLTCGLARKLKDDEKAENGIVIGYDRRFLSCEAARWAAEVMAGEGITTRVIDREAPTPLVMYAVKKDGLPAGMAVTASHNPAVYNGIKVFMEGGRDADEEYTREIEQYISGLEDSDVKAMPYEEGIQKGIIVLTDPMNDYIDSIISAINLAIIRDSNLHIALDPMYGVSKTALQTILLTARCNLDVIHERRDALFGGRLPAPNHKTLAGLMNYVEENHCDIGIATDGDADRLGVIDDKAQFLHPNKILVLLYYYLLKHKGWKGAVVRNLATTHLVDKIAESFGETCYEVPVGFKHISSGMAKTGAIIGGESSGGLTVRGHIQGKDGIYAAALLIEMIASTKMKLSDLYHSIEEEYGTYEMEERDYRFSQAGKDNIQRILFHDKLLPTFPYAVRKVSYLDGCKVYFENGGWIIARFSGTEPLMRIFCEMGAAAEANAAIDIFEKFLELG